MVEVIGNLWDYEADYHVITTNGAVKANGGCVMGRGCAREARDMFPGIDRTLGNAIKWGGNNVHYLGMWNSYRIMSFPVKHHWQEKADIELIKQSVSQLHNTYAYEAKETVVIPRPGCGNGGLDWEYVKPIMALLPDNFYVIDFDR